MTDATKLRRGVAAAAQRGGALRGRAEAELGGAHTLQMDAEQVGGADPGDRAEPFGEIIEWRLFRPGIAI